MQQAILTVFGVPDSVGSDEHGMYAEFGQLRIALPHSKSVKVCSMKIDAILENGVWRADAAQLVGLPMDAPAAPASPPQRAAVQTGAAEQPQRPVATGTVSSFSALARSRAAPPADKAPAEGPAEPASPAPAAVPAAPAAPAPTGGAFASLARRSTMPDAPRRNESGRGGKGGSPGSATAPARPRFDPNNTDGSPDIQF